MRKLFTAEKISLLSKTLKDFDAFTDRFYKSIEGQSPNLHQKTIVDLLARIKINLNSINALLPMLKEYSAAFFSIGLLNRTIIADFISFCYLTGIMIAGKEKNATDEEVNQILQNELRILDIAYVKAMIAAVQLEGKLPEYNTNFATALEDKDHMGRLEKLKETYKDYFQDEDITKKLKSTLELRAIGSDKIFEPGERKQEPKESFMHSFFVKNGFSSYAHTYLLFRFYSQFQHYSPHSLNLIKPDLNDYNFFYLIFTVNYAFIVTDMIIQKVDSLNSPFLSELRTIMADLDNVLKT